MTHTSPITREEMIEMFGSECPIEAVNLVWNATGEKTVSEIRGELRDIAARKKAESIFDKLSDLERERVQHEASEALYAVFNAAHNANGWCGDVMEESWKAGLPIMRETMAKLILRTR